MKYRKIALVLATFLMTSISSCFVSKNNTVLATEQESVNIEDNKIDINEFNNSINAEAYVVIDSVSGEKIMGKNEDKVMYPASLTKIVTSLLLLESGKMDEQFLVSKEADEVGEASIYATEGEYLSGKDLLYAMMLQSANDACYVVAEGVSGDVEAFYSLMTARSKEIGATNSNFTSANGLHETDHVSSAMDLALVTKEALKFDEFREVMGAKTHTLKRTSETGMKEITNKNRMLFESKPEYNEYAIGGKTAYTTPAGNCLMEIASKDGMEIIVVSLKSDSIYQDTGRIINFAFDNFKSTPIVEKGEFVEEYNGEFLNLYTKEGVGYVQSVDSKTTANAVSKEVKISPMTTTVKKGDKIGFIKTNLNGKEYKTIDVYANAEYTFSDINSSGFLRNVIILFIVLVGTKIGINVYKKRKAKTETYLKNSKFY